MTISPQPPFFFFFLGLFSLYKDHVACSVCEASASLFFFCRGLANISLSDVYPKVAFPFFPPHGLSFPSEVAGIGARPLFFFPFPPNTLFSLKMPTRCWGSFFFLRRRSRPTPLFPPRSGANRPRSLPPLLWFVFFFLHHDRLLVFSADVV